MLLPNPFITFHMSRHATPQRLAVPATRFTPLELLRTTPLANPATSSSHRQANSWALAQTPAGAATLTSFPSPETPTPKPTLSPSGDLSPPVDLFRLIGIMEGSTEVFRPSWPRQHILLIDDHRSGVLTTPNGAPVSLRIEPKKIKRVEWEWVQGGVVCVFTIIYHDHAVEGRGPKLTLTLDKARSVRSGMLNGQVHARRLCRRLLEWNSKIEFIPPKK
jgi:hypothetical protein